MAKPEPTGELAAGLVDQDLVAAGRSKGVAPEGSGSGPGWRRVRGQFARQHCIADGADRYVKRSRLALHASAGKCLVGQQCRKPTPCETPTPFRRGIRSLAGPQDRSRHAAFASSPNANRSMREVGQVLCPPVRRRGRRRGGHRSKPVETRGPLTTFAQLGHRVQRTLLVLRGVPEMGCPVFMKSWAEVPLAVSTLLRGRMGPPDCSSQCPSGSGSAPPSILNALNPTVPELITPHRITFPSSGCEVNSAYRGDGEEPSARRRALGS